MFVCRSVGCGKEIEDLQAEKNPSRAQSIAERRENWEKSEEDDPHDRTRKGHHPSHQHPSCFKSNARETSEKRT